MGTASPYTPYRRGPSVSSLNENLLARNRDALFEPLRAESISRRAQSLAQIESNLLSWTSLAYPETNDRLSTPLDNSVVNADSHDAQNLAYTSNEEIFDLDPDTDWSGTDAQVSQFNSSLSSTLAVRPQTPPYSNSAMAYQDPGYGVYSMYGTETDIVDTKADKNELREILNSYLLALLLASVDCPFSDVRRRSRHILHRISMLGASVPQVVHEGPSWLIPVGETVAFNLDSSSEHADSAVLERHASDNSSTGSVDTAEDFKQPQEREKTGTITPIDGRKVLYSDDDFDESVDYVDVAQVASPSQRSDSPPQSTRPAAIPILRKVLRAPVNSSDIDDILLGLVDSSDGIRKARFSVETPSTKSLTRPVLSRRRTNSTTFSNRQRRANANLRTLHISCYMSTGRVSNMGRMLSYFPRCYETILQLHDELLRKEGGPLQRTTKLYLAIMAAAQAKCQYFVSYFTKKFIQLGQNLEWLEGIHRTPPKIQRLGKINALLSQQPWSISQEHKDELLGRPKESVNQGNISDQWTLAELVQSIAIFVVINSQAHFVLSVGLVPEADTFGGARIRSRRRNQQRASTTASVDVIPLFCSYDSRKYASPDSFENKFTSARTFQASSPCMIVPTTTESHRDLKQDDLSDTRSYPASILQCHDDLLQQQILLIEREESQFQICGEIDDDSIDLTSSTDNQPSSSPFWIAENLVSHSSYTSGLLSPTLLHDDSQSNARTAAIMPINPILERMERFYDPDLQRSCSEYDVRSEEFAVLRLTDHNWEDHTCSLIARFVPGLESVLDQGLQEARDAAGDDDDGFFFKDEEGPIDQAPLREAVWFLVLRLYGIKNDGYNYKDVNSLLTTSAKKFIKKVCFSPQSMSRMDWSSIGKGLKSQEKVLLALIASHARQYACLIYGFRYL